ncbi:MAG: mechanosensitive ion channel domain-containing protein [Roseibium sp.]
MRTRSSEFLTMTRRSGSCGKLRSILASLFFAFVLTAVGGVPESLAQGMTSILSQVTSPNGDTSETDSGSGTDKSAEALTDDGNPEEILESLDELSDDAVMARDVLKSILNEIPTIHETMLTALREQGGDKGLRWIPGVLIDVLLSLGIGLAASTLLARWGRRQFATMYRPDVFTRSDKIIYLYLRALLMTAGVALFFVVATLVYLAIGSGLEAANDTAVILFGITALFMTTRAVWLNVLAPDTESHRLIDLTTSEAKGLYRSLLIGAGVSLAAIAFCLWMEQLGLSEDAHKVALIAASALSMLILVVIALVYRTVIARLIRGQDGDETALWRRVLARTWHLIAVLYLVFAFANSAVRILLDLPSATGLVVAPLQVLLAGTIAYGLLILVIDRLLLPRLDTVDAEAVIAEDIQRAEETEGSELDPESALAQAHAEAAERETQRSPFRDLLDRGAAILVLFGALDLLARLWGLQLAGSGLLIGSFIEVLLVMFLGYMAYEAVKIVIDRQIAKEAPAESDEEAEVGGTGESRIATLLPIFRNFLLITIVVIAAMVVLSELGVNIAPLFAGAGVVGLAIGFGAQTLIRDIFSGAFYLIDDAFRKGEYIDIGSAKGVVEKISIRSMQLRHHRGALTTIPFGEIQQVENFSRDWAVMKLAFRVTYDTDVEKMRKIIKTFGKELMDDEYFGPMLLAPLKSQGILAMEDSAMIARVKFTTKPGKQFELRKVVYAGLRDLFEKNGIKFAHRQVTVRVAGEGEDQNSGVITPEIAKAAAAGAAAAGMIEDDQGEQGSGDQI